MAPALRPGNYVLVRTSGCAPWRPRRGDIVVVALSEESRVKRVVGLPGERLVFMEGVLLVNGERLLEPYLQGLPPYLGLEECEFSLPEDAYFVMGDNRAHSTDSRHLGPVVRSSIEGTVVCRIWPLMQRGGRAGD